jgi:hypothetical protein
MTSVTEHLHHPDRVIEAIWQVLDRRGILWIGHHGYHSWSGHHRDPRDVNCWKRNDPSENEVVDWKHLDPSHPCYSNDNLNRIRLEDMRLIVAKYFEIESWHVVLDGGVVERLTPEIRERWRKYSLAELLYRSVEIKGRRRDVPLDIDFADRQFFHPSEDYKADRDYLGEEIERFELAVNGVYFSRGGIVSSHSTNNYAALRLFERLQAGDTIVVRKDSEKHVFTVDEVVRSEGAQTFLRVVEPLPEPLTTTNSMEWTVDP